MIILAVFITVVCTVNTRATAQTDTTQFYSLLYTSDAQTNLNYALLSSSAKGDTVEIWWLLRYGADLETRTSENLTPLFFAAANDKLDAVKMLLKYGADPNVKSNISETPLLVAAKNGNSDMAELLIRDSANIDIADRYGATPLHYSAIYDNLQLTDMLIYYGIAIDRKSFDGTTPLMAAVWSGAVDVADLLLQNGAKTEERDENGFTSLLIAAQNGDTLMMDLLLKNGADLYAVNRYRFDALDICIMAAEKEALNFLLKKGNKWTTNPQKPVSPITAAINYGRSDVVPILKTNGLNERSSRGFDQVNFSASMRFCFHDFYTGFSVSFREPMHKMGVIAGLDFKPGYSRVLTKVNDNLYYQYFDKGSLIYAGAFKEFPVTDNTFKGNWSLTGTISAGYSFGNKLKGTEINPGNKFRILPEAGARWVKDKFTFSVSLLYAKTEFYKVGPIWLRAGISWSMFTNHDRSPAKKIRWY